MQGGKDFRCEGFVLRRLGGEKGETGGLEKVDGRFGLVAPVGCSFSEGSFEL